jgi:hypothetical protein
MKKNGTLLNRYKYEGHLIEMYKTGNSFYAVLDSAHSTKYCLSNRRAFQEAVNIMEGRGLKLASDLREISKKIMEKIAMSPSQIIRKIEKEIDAEIEEAYVKERSLPGSYHYPPEAGEIEITHAYIEKIPELSIEEAEMLPNRFECAVSERFRDEDLNEEADVKLYFDITVHSKNIKPNGKVEIEFSDRFTGWDYD